MLTKKENSKNEIKGNKNTKNASSIDSQQNHNGCCQPLTKTGAQSPAKTSPSQNIKQPYEASSNEKKSSYKTRITIKYDAGYPNQLYIRGKGANLNWDKGQPLKNIKADEWVWETEAHFTHCEFKVLINDHIYENGDNHHLNAGSNLLYTPRFY